MATIWGKIKKWDMNQYKYKKNSTKKNKIECIYLIRILQYSICLFFWVKRYSIWFYIWIGDCMWWECVSDPIVLSFLVRKERAWLSLSLARNSNGK